MAKNKFLNPDKKIIHLLFEFSLWIKGSFVLLEIIGGAIFYFVSQNYFVNFIFVLTQNELGEDPTDFIANYLISFSQDLFLSTQHFIALYLLSHGLIKLGVILCLLKNKLWAYPASIFIFLTFILYQFYRFYFTHSPWLLVLTVFDMIMVWLIWREYSFVKKNYKF